MKDANHFKREIAEPSRNQHLDKKVYFQGK